MKPEEAIKQMEEFMVIDDWSLVYLPELHDALELAVKALMDNKPSRIWIAKNEYRRGWHDAITKALSESMKIHVENETFDMVQKETLIGLGLSMDSAIGAEPYSETDESYPESDRPHAEWIPITYRPMDEEEYEDFKKEFGELPIEERKMFSCPMPEDDQEILICNSWGGVSQDRCEMDECGYGLEENGDWDGIVAWMPLPEPYKKEGGAE